MGHEIWEGSGAATPSSKAFRESLGKAGPPAPPPDDLPDALIPDGEHAANVNALHGFLWCDKEGEGKRLYLTWLLDEYIDLTGVDILYWRKVPFDGGTIVWVDRKKNLRRIRVPQQPSSQEIFLTGPISEVWLSGAPDPGAGGGSGAPDTALCWNTKGC